MLIYCNILKIKDDKGVDKLLQIVAKWLGKKTGTYLTAESFGSGALQNKTDRGSYNLHAAVDTFPALYSVQFSHADRKVPGRQWITEVGIRREDPDGEAEITVLLRTSEISPRVKGDIQASRPIFISQIAATCELEQSIPGQKIKHLTEENARAFTYEIDRDERTHPIIVVSPVRDNGYLVDIDHLRSLLLGLADVIQIPQNANTYKIADILGSRYSCWGGAINIIQPARRTWEDKYIGNILLLPDEISELLESGQKAENEILTRICHRTNLPLSWKHISPSIVREKQIKDELIRRKREAKKSGEADEYIQLLEEVNSEQITRIAELQEGKIQLEEALLGKDDEISKTQYEIEGLKVSLNKRSSRKSLDVRITQDERNAIFKAIDGYPTPEECLTCAAIFYSDRLIILDTAWNSSLESTVFKHGSKLFSLLMNLGEEYWGVLQDGGAGDSKARKIFGSNYAAKESDTVKGNKELCRHRIFQYKGADVLMLKHIKIGVKDSAEETIRVNFHWDSADRVIAIGYCGPHLPLK